MQRDPWFGCPRIAQQINKAFGIDIDKNLVQRVSADQGGADWLLRSRHHARVGIDPEIIALGHKPGIRLRDYAKACSKVLALAHARGDRRSARFEWAMSDASAREAYTRHSFSLRWSR